MTGMTTRRRVAALAPVLLGLAACAAPMTTPTPAATPPPVTETPVRRAVRELLANQEAGRVHTISGVGFVIAPIAVPLANAEVSLLPLTPDLESVLAKVQRRWLAGRRQPLPHEVFQAAFAVMTAQRVAVGRAGGEALIRFATTNDKGAFEFDQIPEGRWLLVATMSSQVSTLLWTMPVEVGAEDPPQLFLTDANLLLETRRGTQDGSSTRP